MSYKSIWVMYWYNVIGPRGVLGYFHIRRLGQFLGVQNSEFQYFWGFSGKLIFLGCDEIVLMSTQNWTISGVISIRVRFFFTLSMYRIGIFLRGC